MFSNNSIYINDGLNASFASVTLIRPLLPLLFQLFPFAVKLLKSNLTYLFDFFLIRNTFTRQRTASSIKMKEKGHDKDAINMGSL